MDTPEEPAHWERIAREHHAACKVFDVYKERFRHQADGREGDFFTIDAPGWVNVVALTPREELVLVRQFRFGSRALSWEVPGGVMEPGEDPESAAARELEEETGYHGGTARLLGQCQPNPALFRNTCHFVLIERVQPGARLGWDEHEELEMQLMPLPEAFRRARDGFFQHALALNALFALALDRGALP